VINDAHRRLFAVAADGLRSVTWMKSTRRVQLLEALIDRQTTLLYQKPGHARVIAMELRSATGLPPLPQKSAE
jgi:hypothetical protein